MSALKQIVQEVRTNQKRTNDEIGKLSDENKSLKGQIEQLEQIIRASKGEFLPGLADEMEREKRKPSIMGIVRGIYFNEWGDGFEKRVLEDARKAYDRKQGEREPGVKRVMGTNTDSGGGYVVPPEFMTDIIENLKAKMRVLQAGARFIDGLNESPVYWPRIDSSVSTYWAEENNALTASDLALGQLKAEPKRVGAAAILSKRLIRMSNPKVDAELEREMAEQLGLAVDSAVLQGTGGDAQPRGLKNRTGDGVQTANFSGAALTRSNFLSNFTGPVEDANGDIDDPTTGLITHGGVLRGLQQERIAQFSGDTGGEYVQHTLVSRRQLAEEIGIGGLYGTNQIARDGSTHAEAYFGIWNQLLLLQWFGMILETSEHAEGAFLKSQMVLKMETEVDLIVRHPSLFVYGSDIEANF